MIYVVDQTEKKAFSTKKVSFIVGSILCVSSILLVLLYHNASIKQQQRKFHYYAQSMANSLWDFNKESAKGYLTVVCSLSNYTNLVVWQNTDKKFITVQNSIDSNIFTRLIKPIKLETNIVFQDQVIGTMHADWHSKTVMVSAFTLLIIVLTGTSILLFLNTVANKRNLEIQVFKRTNELAREVEEKDKALSKAQQSESFYRQLFDHSTSGVAVYEEVENGQDFIFKDFNKAAEEIEGVCRGDLLGRRLTEAFPGVNKSGILDVFQRVWRTGEPIHPQEAYYVDERVQGWRDNKVYKLPSGEIVALFYDITSEKQLEEEKGFIESKLEQAHKMESIGLMAGGVAHDLNNILSGVIGYPEMLLKTLPKDSELRAPIKAIHESGHRAATVVADLLTIARSVAIKREDHDINTLIENYLNSPECKKLTFLNPNITFRHQSESTNSIISCSPVHVHKCIMNLVINGCEAINGAGTMTLSTYNQDNDGKAISKHEIEAGEYVVLNVQDTGSGILKEDIEHIFEPFYTKKVMGKSGSGLGLAVVWNTMEEHNGKVSVDSNENGTSFQLYFPIKKGVKVSQIDNESDQKMTGGDAYILVVDDEPQLRDIARMMLENLGYRVDVVESGESAIEFVRKKPVDLLLIDMLMEPGMNGRQTYEEITKLYPKQKAVVASGFSESDDVKATLQLGAGGFIMKPYSTNQLGQVVKEALDS